MVGLRRPVVLEASDVTAAPNNVQVDGQQVLLFRPAPDAAPRLRREAARRAARRRCSFDNASAGSVVVLVRALDARRLLALHPDAAFIEVNSKTLWTAEGSGVARTKSAGKHLQPVPVDDDVDWDVMKYWYPDLKLTAPDQSKKPFSRHPEGCFF